MLTLMRIQTSKGPRVVCLRDLQPEQFSELTDSAAAHFTIAGRWARYDRSTRKMEVTKPWPE